MDRLHTSKRECLEAKNFQGQRVGISDNDIRKRKLPGRRVYCALPVCAFQIKTSCQPSMTTLCMAHDCTDHRCHNIESMRFRTLPWDAALIPDHEKLSTHLIFPLCLTPKRLLSGKCDGTSFRSKGPSASPRATSCNVWSQTECAISESKKTTCPYERPSLCSLAWLGNAALLLSL